LRPTASKCSARTYETPQNPKGEVLLFWRRLADVLFSLITF
jgi:hypothetical protein